MKKLLALVLALVMVMGLSVVSTNAAFSDGEAIEHTEAVEVLSALGVINGMGDGTFQPEGDVTRAQMAKMIAIILLGADVNDSAFKGASSDLTDINGHWAEGFIKYCVSQGVVAGRGNGIFDPNANVTTAEAAKMLLVALGYNSEVQEYIGSNWSINVIRDASTKKLFAELGSLSANKALSRDEASQMIYNTITAAMIIKTAGQERTSDGKITDSYTDTGLTGNPITLLGETFEGKVFVGRFSGNYDSSAANREDEIAIYGKLDTAAAGAALRTASFPGDLDISLVGEEFKVVFKDGKGGVANTPDKEDTIYGVFNTDKAQAATSTRDKVADNKTSDQSIKVDGVVYNVADTVYVNFNYVNTSLTGGTYTAYTGAQLKGDSNTNSVLTAALKGSSGDTIKLVCDDDGKVERIYFVNYNMTYISGLSNGKATLAGVGAIELNKHNNSIYADAAKDDVVVYTKLYKVAKDDATFDIVKAESVEGTLKGFRKDNTPYNVVVDGTTYKAHNNAFAQVTSDAADCYTIAGMIDSNVNDDVRVYLVNGFAGGMEKLSATKLYAIIKDADTVGKALNSDLKPFVVSLMLADGTTVTKSLHKDSLSAVATAVVAGDLVEGALIKYTNSGDKIKTTEIAAPTAITNATAGVNGGYAWNSDTRVLNYAANQTLALAAATSGTAASGSVIFVQDKQGNFSTTDLRGLKNFTVAATDKLNAIKDSDGLIAAAYLEVVGSAFNKPGTSSDKTVYGIVSDYVGYRNIGDTTYQLYAVAQNDNKDNDVTVWVEAATQPLALIAKGDLVYFDKSNDDLYNPTDIELVFDASTGALGAGATIGAVKNYSSGDRLVNYYGGTSRATAASAYAGVGAVLSKTLDKNAKIVYSNLDGNKGGESIGIGAFNTVTGNANVVMVDKDADDVIDVVYVDTSDVAELNGAAFAQNAAFAYTSNVFAATAIGTSGDTFTVVSDVADGPVAFGTPITLTFTQTTPAGVAADANMKITVYNGATVLGTLTLDGSGVLPAANTITFAMPDAACNLTYGFGA